MQPLSPAPLKFYLIASFVVEGVDGLTEYRGMACCVPEELEKMVAQGVVDEASKTQLLFSLPLQVL